MRIAVIGTGKIGGTLGRAWARAGHVVTFGSRHPADEDVAGDSDATVAGISDALAAADVVLLALPGRSVGDLLVDHAAGIAGKLVIDATNQVGAAVVNACEQIAAATRTARYVRAFNTLGWENFADPLFDGVPAATARPPGLRCGAGAAVLGRRSGGLPDEQCTADQLSDSSVTPTPAAKKTSPRITSRTNPVRPSTSSSARSRSATATTC